MDQQEGIAEVNGTRLYYECTGSGHPLILIHGFTLDSRMWKNQFETFGKYYQVIRYDVRGFGRSDLPTVEPYSRPNDLKALLGHLDISNANILGISMGGKIAIDFALENPEMVDSLILADAALGGYQWKEFGESLASVFDIARKSGVEVGKELWSSLDLFKSAIEKPDVFLALAQMLNDYSGWHFINDDPFSDLDPPSIQRLNEISVPTLIIIGEFDSTEFHSIGDILQEQISNARKVILPSVGHVTNMEAPDSFNGLVLDFLAGL
jgi:pimeloyl-ACP methyl ester carboxylesterase